MRATTRKRSSQVPARTVQLTDAQRREELAAFVGLCFSLLEGMSHEAVAAKAKLSCSTIRKFRNGGFTLNCRFNTVQCLGYAAGLAMTVSQSKITVQLI